MKPENPDWETLQSRISGEVILPGSPGYEEARKPDIPRFHGIKPQAIVMCENPGDVSAAISFTKRLDLETAIRSGGHSFAGQSSTEGVVVDVSRIESVEISGGVATVGAGARLGDVYDALDGHGLTIPAGCGPTVGISGLTLGGGLGILGRKHGLTADHLVGAQVILADGRIMECDEQRNEDLLWALRGAGGGNFGVVTSLTFDTIAAPDVTVFHLTWPHKRMAEVIEAWQEWSPDGPDELAGSLLVTIPANANEPPAVNVFGAMQGTEPETVGLLGGLAARVRADPESTSHDRMSYREAKEYLAELGEKMAGDRPRNGHSFSKSEFFRRPLPPDAVAQLVDNFGRERVAGQPRELDFSPWGGAYNRVPSDATAFFHRDERFLLKHAVEVAPDATEPEREAARRWLIRSWETVHPWGSGGVYPNFPDPELEGWERAYFGTNHERLTRVKAKYDPEGFFRFHQSIRGRVRRSKTSDKERRT